MYYMLMPDLVDFPNWENNQFSSHLDIPLDSPTLGTWTTIFCLEGLKKFSLIEASMNDTIGIEDIDLPDVELFVGS